MEVNRAARVAISWADAEGWNPGLDDDERFLAADPDSFLATELHGEIVATVSCALYGQAYAFIGFYIVRSDLRGRGIGSPLFERALGRAGGRIVGLDGVLAQQGSYERRGFVLAHRNVRWRTMGGGERPDGLVELSPGLKSSSRSTPLSSDPSESASCGPGSTGLPVTQSRA